jgi:MoaA/NifB/PqqE/SkfB family radical SAM enzyme
MVVVHEAPAAVEALPIFRKDTAPSRSMLPPDGHRYTCQWLESSLTIHCDGNVSCGLDDPHAGRSFGNVNESSLADIYANPEIDRMRAALWEGRKCHACALYLREPGDVPVPRPRAALPATLVIEPTVTCNIRCAHHTCDINNDSAQQVRAKPRMELDEFKHMVDQAAPALQHVYFFNYGESFVNRVAGEMLLHLREACPAVVVTSSTNGIPLSKGSNAEALVRARLDSLTFTISGVIQPSYEKYHLAGKVDQALQGMLNVCAAKAALAQSVPRVDWRYIAFRWNDSEAEVDAAIALSRLYGVDRFVLFLTNIPHEASSYRLAPGTRLHQKYAEYIQFVHDFASITPDEDGLWAPEHFTQLGPGRWTSWRARLAAHRDGNWIRLAIAGAGGRGGHCFVRTAWGAFKVPIGGTGWTRVSLLVPQGERAGSHQVEIVAPQAWFPCDESGGNDQRCLGVIVGDQPQADDLQDALSWAGILAAGLDDRERRELAALPAFSVCVEREPYLSRFRERSARMKAAQLIAPPLAS